MRSFCAVGSRIDIVGGHAPNQNRTASCRPLFAQLTNAANNPARFFAFGWRTGKYLDERGTFTSLALDFAHMRNLRDCFAPCA
jgi:hypothetical protein